MPRLLLKYVYIALLFIFVLWNISKYIEDNFNQFPCAAVNYIHLLWIPLLLIYRLNRSNESLIAIAALTQLLYNTCHIFSCYLEIYSITFCYIRTTWALIIFLRNRDFKMCDRHGNFDKEKKIMLIEQIMYSSGFLLEAKYSTFFPQQPQPIERGIKLS